jgi:4-amino-4-deoxy-L-arabinose transferase-like glycosyltransferase
VRRLAPRPSSHRTTPPGDLPPDRPQPPAFPATPTLLQLTGVGVLACAVRLIHVNALANTPIFSILLGDSKRYVEWGADIAGGNWLGTEVFYQSPLYPYVLAAAFSVFGQSVDMIRTLQALAGGLACVLAAIAGSWLFDRRAGLATGMLLALYPTAIFFDGHIQKSSIDFVLTATMLLGIAGYLSTQRVRWVLLLGTALGCLMLNRENARPLLPFLAAWFFVYDRSRPVIERLRIAGVFVLAACVPMAPVALRNYYVGGEALFSTAQLGPNFYIGNRIGASGIYEPLVPDRGSVEFERADATALATAAAGRALTPSEVSDYWLAKTFDEIRTDPAAWARLLGRKTLLAINTVEVMDTESQEFHAGYSAILRALAPFSFGALLPVAMLGLVLTAADARRLGVLYGTCLVLFGSVVLFFVMSRYRHPLVPVLALFAGAGIAYLPARWRERRRHAIVAAGSAIVVALVVNIPIRVTSDESYGNFGAELLRLDRPREAIPLLERSAALLPDEAASHRDLGLAYLKAGQTAAAAREYARVVELEPYDAMNRRELAVAAEAAGDQQAALLHLREAARLADEAGDNVERVRALVRIAAIEMRGRRPDEALTLLREAAVVARASGQTAVLQDLEATIGALGRESR